MTAPQDPASPLAASVAAYKALHDAVKSAAGEQATENEQTAAMQLPDVPAKILPAE